MASTLAAWPGKSRPLPLCAWHLCSCPAILPARLRPCPNFCATDDDGVRRMTVVLFMVGYGLVTTSEGLQIDCRTVAV